MAKTARKPKVNGQAKLQASQLAEYGLPMPTTEHRFHPDRGWRFDFAWPAQKVALEVEGGVFTGGRHVSGSGFVEDMLKYNEAVRLGWRLVRVLPDKLLSAYTVDLVGELLRARPA